jgi:hypothetical protein
MLLIFSQFYAGAVSVDEDNCQVDVCLIGGGHEKCTLMHLFCILPDKNKYLGVYLEYVEPMPGFQQFQECWIPQM